MKKVFISLMTFFAVSGVASAQEVKVENLEAFPGETVSMLMYIDTNGGSYTGMEFDIQFPQAGFTTNGGVNKVQDWSPTIAIGKVGQLGENMARCGVQDMNSGGTPMPDVEGLRPFLSVNITVADNMALDDYTVSLENITLIEKTGRVPVSDCQFTLSVVNVKTIILDENSTTAPAAATGVNVKVLRTINAGNWSTIVLPFDMDENQVKAAFGDKVQIKNFTGYEFDEDADIVNVNFEDVSPLAIAKNHPYIIKVKENISEFVVEGVDIAPTEQPMVNVGTGTKKRTIKAFVGTYVADFDFYNESNNIPLFLSGNQFWYASEDTQTMMAFRGYFDFCDVPEYAEEGQSRFVLNFDKQTGINNVTTQQEGEYYNLNGLRVETPSKGIFIKDGKKVVVK